MRPATFLSIATLTLAAGCGGKVTTSAATPADPVTHASASLTADGSTVIDGQTASGAATSVEISAPILPRVLSKDGGDLYSHQGPNYPKTPDEERQVADAAAVTYAELLATCASLHPEIQLPSAGASLSQDALSANLDAVGRCAYEDLGIKPYWIPQLIDDVDVCADRLGPGWRLPTQADLDALSDLERAAWQAVSRGELFGGGAIYVRAADGSLQLGGLGPGDRALRGFVDLSGGGYDPRSHYEGGANLQCLRGSTH